MFKPTDRIVFLHAHPDDETLASGALIAGLIAQGHPVAVVTATRGERCEVMPGPLAALSGAQLVAQRECELRRALADLGVTQRAWLGTPPARVAGRGQRRYLDSGMRWVTETLAGPAADAGPESLSLAPIEEAAADLSAFLSAFRADVVISYDELGGYGHPDHLACHHIAKAAAGSAGFVEIVSEPRFGLPGVVALEHREQLARLRRALAGYPSQFNVVGPDVVHVGGQRQPITTSARLRWVE